MSETMTLKSGSRLEHVLAAGQFAVTAELGPPKSADPGVIKSKAAHLRGVVDAVNITDNQTAIVRMSSIAAGARYVRKTGSACADCVRRCRARSSSLSFRVFSCLRMTSVS